MIECNNRKYFSSFLLLCILLIFLMIIKKNILYKEYEKEHFLGLNKQYNNISNLLSNKDIDKNTIEHAENKNNTTIKLDNDTKALINKEVRTAISNINMPEGVQGPQGPIGPSGGIYQNKGYLTSNKNIDDLKPLKMATALKPIGNLGSPILLTKSDYNSDKKWMMNADGSITNQYLGDKYCLYLNEDNSTQYGKYSLLELINSDTNSCTKFVEDNNSRLKIKDTNNCMTIKNTSNMSGLNLSVPNTSKCSLSEITNSECKLEDDTQVLGVDICNDIIKPEQTFIWL